MLDKQKYYSTSDLMKGNGLHILKTLVTAFAVTLFFSCENNIKDVQQVGILQNQPVGEALDIDLKYTELTDKKSDSVRLVANLLSDKMKDYSNREFSFSEFPDGIELYFYDNQNHKTKITSNYAIYYNQTNLIDLQGEVTIITHEKDTLLTEQLYYSEKSKWLFTNKTWLFKKQDGPKHGIGFDSDKSFEKFQMLELGGEFQIDK